MFVKSNLELHLDFADMIEDAKRRGYEEPRCAVCLHAMFVRGQPDHGLCRAHNHDANHYQPIRAWELCERWKPRWGILRDSLMALEQEEARRRAPKRKLPVLKTGPTGDLGPGW